MNLSDKSNSPLTRSKKRLLKNKPAIAGLMVILVAIIVAVFGYFIAPDNTPNANDQILQLETHPPGFAVDMLLRTKNRSDLSSEDYFWWVINGIDNPYEFIPVNNYHFSGTQIVFEEYTGKNRSAITDSLPLVDVVFRLSNSDPLITVHGETISFRDFEGNKQTAQIWEMQKEIEAAHIENKRFLLGTDKFGRDVLSRLILGVRVSLSVGIVAVIISLIIGILFGSIAGYFRGRIDDAFMWLINVVWSIPTLLLVFAMILVLGQSFWLIYVAVGLTMWVEMARIVRGQFFSIREKEFVEAAQSLGFSNFRTIFRHILPNISGPIIVIAAQNFATAILIEAGLSFLGIGVQPPKPSWGGVLNEYYKSIGTDSGFLALYPALAIMLMVLAFNLVGNGLRDALDVKTNL